MDLTKITTPFGLLPPETQKALEEHGGPIEVYTIDGAWDVILDPRWQNSVVYRVKPEPPKPREIWLVDPSQRQKVFFYSLQEARDYGWKDEELTRFVEVIE